MHTFQKGKWYIHHNGDYSGDVIIVKEGKVAGVMSAVGEMHIPFTILRDFIAGYVRDRQIADLNDAGADEILGVRSACKAPQDGR